MDLLRHALLSLQPGHSRLIAVEAVLARFSLQCFSLLITGGPTYAASRVIQSKS